MSNVDVSILIYDKVIDFLGKLPTHMDLTDLQASPVAR